MTAARSLVVLALLLLPPLDHVGARAGFPATMSLALLALAVSPPPTDRNGYYGVLVDGALGLPGLAALAAFAMS